MFGTLRLCKGHDERPGVCGGRLSKDVRVMRSSYVVLGGVPRLPGRPSPSRPALSCRTCGHVTHWLLGTEGGACVSLASTDHHVSQEEGCWTRVWCPQIHRGISLERTSCGRKRLRLRLLTTGGEPGVYHLPSAPLCHFSLVCHRPSHTQRHLYLAQGSCDHSKLHFLPLRTHTFILVLAFPAQL